MRMRMRSTILDLLRAEGDCNNLAKCECQQLVNRPVNLIIHMRIRITCCCKLCAWVTTSCVDLRSIARVRVVCASACRKDCTQVLPPYKYCVSAANAILKAKFNSSIVSILNDRMDLSTCRAVPRVSGACQTRAGFWYLHRPIHVSMSDVERFYDLATTTL